MSVITRGNSHQAKFRIDGHPYLKSFSSYAEAEGWEADVRHAVKRGLPIPGEEKVVTPKKVVSTELTIGQAVDNCYNEHWITKKAPHIPRVNSGVFVAWAGKDTPISEALSKDNLFAFLKYLRETREVCAKTLNRYTSTIRVVAKHSKFDMPTLPYHREPEGNKRFFTRDEYFEIIEYFEEKKMNRWRDFFIFLCDTGARPWGEASGLTWKHITEGRMTLVGETTKTGKTRVIPLTARAQAAIKRQHNLGLEGPWFDLYGQIGHDVWCDLRLALPHLDDTVWYTCRHTCASWQVQANVPIFSVSKFLGHASVETTMIYAHLAPEHLADNLRAFEAA
jgi:integrase